MTPSQQDVFDRLRALASGASDPHAKLASDALQMITTMLANKSQADGVQSRLRGELAEREQRLRATENVAHNADKRVNAYWRLVHDVGALLLRLDAVLPVEHRKERELIDDVLKRLNPPAPPAMESP